MENMKNKYKVAIILAVAAVFLAPVLIFAQGKRSGPDEEKGNVKNDSIILDRGLNRGGAFCEAIENIYLKIEEKLTKREKNLENKEENILNKIRERREERERKMEQRREKWDKNRTEHFTKLKEKAGTNEQKQAVLEFVQTIGEAVKIRREAFDKAINDFRKGLDEIQDRRTVVLLEAVADYKEAGSKIFEKAKTDCENGVDIKIIRRNLRDGLKDIRNAYREDIKHFGGHGSEIHELNEAKKEAMNKAKDNFKEILEQSLENLKAGFPEIEGDEGSEDD